MERIHYIRILIFEVKIWIHFIFKISIFWSLHGWIEIHLTNYEDMWMFGNKWFTERVIPTVVHWQALANTSMHANVTCCTNKQQRSSVHVYHAIIRKSKILQANYMGIFTDSKFVSAKDSTKVKSIGRVSNCSKSLLQSIYGLSQKKRLDSSTPINSILSSTKAL